MDAAELSCQSAKGISALRFQLLKTDGEIVGLLSRFAGEFQVNELQETTLYLRIADVQLRFQARCMEGGQRCVLPDDLLLQIRKQLERGQEVTLHNKKQLVKLEPAKFMKYYRKLEKK
ncbi:MAG: hypothetical protein SP1CHLAM42_09800 [Chlamydiales bacterium]|nr:hypothetical protein [Chlamydiales bacterium]